MIPSVLDAVDLSYGSCTDPGLRRDNNEDALLAERPVFLVADGIGGHAAGEVASRSVVEVFRGLVSGPEIPDLGLVGGALAEADRRVSLISVGHRLSAGTTVTGAVLVTHHEEPFWLVFNAGDSRVYRQFGAELEQLTLDHTVVQERVDAGSLSPEEAATAPGHNVLTRALGAPDSRVDSWLMPVTTGERLLLCSDGLHRELNDEGILQIMMSAGRPESTARSLVEAAKRAGGRDNVSVIVVDVRAGGARVDVTATTGRATRAGQDEDTVKV